MESGGMFPILDPQPIFEHISIIGITEYGFKVNRLYGDLNLNSFNIELSSCTGIYFDEADVGFTQNINVNGSNVISENATYTYSNSPELFPAFINFNNSFVDGILDGTGNVTFANNKTHPIRGAGYPFPLSPFYFNDFSLSTDESAIKSQIIASLNVTSEDYNITEITLDWGDGHSYTYLYEDFNFTGDFYHAYQIVPIYSYNVTVYVYNSNDEEINATIEIIIHDNMNDNEYGYTIEPHYIYTYEQIVIPVLVADYYTDYTRISITPSPNNGMTILYNRNWSVGVEPYYPYVTYNELLLSFSSIGDSKLNISFQEQWFALNGLDSSFYTTGEYFYINITVHNRPPIVEYANPTPITFAGKIILNGEQTSMISYYDFYWQYATIVTPEGGTVLTPEIYTLGGTVTENLVISGIYLLSITTNIPIYMMSFEVYCSNNLTFNSIWSIDKIGRAHV
jgi:hypothetical protein